MIETVVIMEGKWILSQIRSYSVTTMYILRIIVTLHEETSQPSQNAKLWDAVAIN